MMKRPAHQWIGILIFAAACFAVACSEEDSGTGNGGTTSGGTSGTSGTSGDTFGDSSGSGTDSSGGTNEDGTSGTTQTDTSGSSGSDTSGNTSGTTQTDTSGSSSGDTSDTSGSSSGDTSGSSGGDTSGNDDTSGSSGGDTSGADDTSGSSGGDTSGSTSGDTSGSTSGTTVCVPSCGTGFACVEGACVPVNDIPSPSVANEVIFTEVMSNPRRNDSNGEWMEFYNAGDVTYNLRGCVVVQGTGGQFTINATSNGMVLQPGQHATTGGAGDAALGFDATFNYSSSTFIMSDNNNTLTLRCGGVDIDAISFTTSTAGFSHSLDPASYDATANDDEGNWCDSPATAYSTSPAEEHGSPNTLNPACP